MSVWAWLQHKGSLGAWAAGLGGLVALGLAPVVYLAEPALLGPVHVLLLLAVLVVAPLALALTAQRNEPGRACSLHRAACAVWPVAALAMASAFLCPAGRLAGMIRSHGVLNALFVVASLAGWYVAGAATVDAASVAAAMGPSVPPQT